MPSINGITLLFAALPVVDPVELTISFPTSFDLVASPLCRLLCLLLLPIKLPSLLLA